VESPSPAAPARSDCVISNKARAALHCAGVIDQQFWLTPHPGQRINNFCR
jgi:hypothetical protein